MAGFAATLVSVIADGVTGVIAGGLVVGALALVQRLRGARGRAAAGG
jgi:hypothetical protein